MTGASGEMEGDIPARVVVGSGVSGGLIKPAGVPLCKLGSVVVLTGGSEAGGKDVPD
jgi:hypothetical protein